MTLLLRVSSKNPLPHAGGQGEGLHTTPLDTLPLTRRYAPASPGGERRLE